MKLHSHWCNHGSNHNSTFYFLVDHSLAQDGVEGTRYPNPVNDHPKHVVKCKAISARAHICSTSLKIGICTSPKTLRFLLAIFQIIGANYMVVNTTQFDVKLPFLKPSSSCSRFQWHGLINTSVSLMQIGWEQDVFTNQQEKKNRTNISWGVRTLLYKSLAFCTREMTEKDVASILLFMYICVHHN